MISFQIPGSLSPSGFKCEKWTIFQNIFKAINYSAMKNSIKSTTSSQSNKVGKMHGSQAKREKKNGRRFVMERRVLRHFSFYFCSKSMRHTRWDSIFMLIVAEGAQCISSTVEDVLKSYNLSSHKQPDWVVELCCLMCSTDGGLKEWGCRRQLHVFLLNDHRSFDGLSEYSSAVAQFERNHLFTSARNVQLNQCRQFISSTFRSIDKCNISSGSILNDRFHFSSKHFMFDTKSAQEKLRKSHFWIHISPCVR